MSSRLNVAVIGAGPVGLAMAKAIADAGHAVMAIATTDPARAEQVSAVLPGIKVSSRIKHTTLLVAVLRQSVVT